MAGIFALMISMLASVAAFRFGISVETSTTVPGTALKILSIKEPRRSWAVLTS